MTAERPRLNRAERGHRTVDCPVIVELWSSPVEWVLCEPTGQLVGLFPLDPEFAPLLVASFQCKYPEPFRSAQRPSPWAHRTRETWLTGWRGKSLLRGVPETLTVLYDAGPGQKNAAGFERFEAKKSPAGIDGAPSVVYTAAQNSKRLWYHLTVRNLKQSRRNPQSCGKGHHPHLPPEKPEKFISPICFFPDRSPSYRVI